MFSFLLPDVWDEPVPHPLLVLPVARQAILQNSFLIADTPDYQGEVEEEHGQSDQRSQDDGDGEVPDRRDFLLLDPAGKIIGESTINEIDWEARNANFRIAIFRPEYCGQGIGSWAVRTTRDFAFETLKLHRLELNVFSFNPRAERSYEKAGFRREGVRRDAVRDGDGYGDDILMAILEDEWREVKAREAGLDG